MMSRIYTVVLLFIFSLPAFSAPILTDSAKISLLTCSPGQELYSLYGHSAIRVKDTDNALDLVFNYGTFDFNTPNFYMKFANGNLKYMLSVGRFKGFLEAYFNDERSVWEQELNLNQVEKQRLFDALAVNAAPENKYYRYDFFFDNCATRIRDIIYSNVDGQISYVDTINNVQSFRAFIHEYEYEMPWIKDGLDILLGLRTDDMADINDQMFLPDYLMLYFGRAVISKDGETPRSLVKQMNPLLRFEPEEEEPVFFSPTVWFWILLIVSILLLFYEVKSRNKPVQVFNRIVFISAGIIGVLIVFLWFFTRHGVTGENFNILWANPILLFIGLLPVSVLKNTFFKILHMIVLVGLSVMAILWFLIPQSIPSMVFPIVILLMVRIGFLYRHIYS